MASYLQGDQPYLPQVQPWSPDFNFYQKAMSQKQQQYDIGWQKVNTLYNSLLNAPMLREDDIARRDQFFKTIEGEIHKLSGIDLSKPQNVDAASQVFKPLIQDDYIINDIKWTKKFQKEMSRAEYFRNCIDPKKCGGKYWEEGERALQYRAQDFKNASADKALQMAGPKYTPYSNAMEKAFDKIKEMDFGTSITYSDGKWMVTEKNGGNFAQSLMSYLAQTVGRDPEVLSMYETKAYVNRKDWLSANEGNYASPEEASSAYYQNFMPSASKTVKGVADDVKSSRKNKEAEVALIEQDIANNGMIPNSKEHKKYQDSLTELDKLLGIENELEVEKENVKNISNSTNTDSMSLNSDRAIANALLYNDLFQAAASYQQLTYEREISGADPYALAGYQSSLRRQEAKDKFKYDATLEILKNNLKTKKALESDMGGADQQVIELRSSPENVGETTEGKEDPYEYNLEEINKMTSEVVSKNRNKYLDTAYEIFARELINTPDDLQMKRDFISTFIDPIKKDKQALTYMYGEEVANKIMNDEYANDSKLIEEVLAERSTSSTKSGIGGLAGGALSTMFANAEKALTIKGGRVNTMKPYFMKFHSALKNTYQAVQADKASRDFIKTVPKVLKDAAYPAFGNFALDKENGLTKEMMGIESDEEFNRITGIGLKEFMDEDGYIVDYNDYRENVLKKISPLYDKYNQLKESGVNPLSAITTQDILEGAYDKKKIAKYHNELLKKEAAGEITLDQKKQALINKAFGDMGSRVFTMYNGKTQKGVEGYLSYWEQLTIRMGTADPSVLMKATEQQMLDAMKTKEGQKGLRDRYYDYMRGDNPGALALRSIDGGLGGLYGGMEALIENIEAKSPTSRKSRAADDILRNIIAAEENILLTPEGGYTSDTADRGLGTTPQEVVSVVNDMHKYIFENNWNKKDTGDDYPVYDIIYNAGFQGGNKMHKVHLTFPEKFLEDKELGVKYKSGGAVDKQGTAENRKFLSTKGIDLYIPIDNVNNIIADNAYRSPVDVAFDIIGEYDFGEQVPNSGNLKLKKVNKTAPDGTMINSYELQGAVEIFNLDGTTQKLTANMLQGNINQKLGLSTDAGNLIEYLNPYLLKVAAMNEANKNKYYAQNAEFDPENLK